VRLSGPGIKPVTASVFPSTFFDDGHDPPFATARGLNLGYSNHGEPRAARCPLPHGRGSDHALVRPRGRKLAGLSDRETKSLQAEIEAHEKRIDEAVFALYGVEGLLE